MYLKAATASDSGDLKPANHVSEGNPIKNSDRDYCGMHFFKAICIPLKANLQKQS